MLSISFTNIYTQAVKYTYLGWLNIYVLHVYSILFWDKVYMDILTQLFVRDI